IVDSKRCIEQKLGVKIQTFAYPNGRPSDFGEGTKRCLREAGYTCAVTTVAGVNGAGQDVFELRRGQPWEEDIAVFATKLHWYSRRRWCPRPACPWINRPSIWSCVGRTSKRTATALSRRCDAISRRSRTASASPGCTAAARGAPRPPGWWWAVRSARSSA